MSTLTVQLRSVPLFARLHRRALAQAASLLTPVTLTAGEVICRAGELGREALVIVAGTATVVRDGERVATLGPGDLVGELALLRDGYRTATVVADTDVTALVMSIREFVSLLALPGMRDAIEDIAATRVTGV